MQYLILNTIFSPEIPKYTIPAFEVEESKCIFSGEWVKL